MATPAGAPDDVPTAYVDDTAAAKEEEFCTRYAVFCTTQINRTSLDSFLMAVRTECPPDGGAVLRVITAQSGVGSIADTPRADGGTRPPVSDFQTPFAGQSVSALRDEFVEAMEEVSQGWAVSCFAVLDERFLKDGTVLLISIDEEEEEEDDSDEEEEMEGDQRPQMLNHRCDPRITLDLLRSFEMNRVGVDAHDDDSEDFNHVLTYRYFRELNGAVFPAGE